MAYEDDRAIDFKILVTAVEYRTYTVPAQDAEQAAEIFRNDHSGDYEVGDDLDEFEIIQIWEA